MATILGTSSAEEVVRNNIFGTNEPLPTVVWLTKKGKTQNVDIL